MLITRNVDQIKKYEYNKDDIYFRKFKKDAKSYFDKKHLPFIAVLIYGMIILRKK